MRWIKFSLAVFLVLFLAQVSSATDPEPPLKVVWTSRLGVVSSNILPDFSVNSGIKTSAVETYVN